MRNLLSLEWAKAVRGRLLTGLLRGANLEQPPPTCAYAAGRLCTRSRPPCSRRWLSGKGVVRAG
jgi:hypothetical protein